MSDTIVAAVPRSLFKIPLPHREAFAFGVLWELNGRRAGSITLQRSTIAAAFGLSSARIAFALLWGLQQRGLIRMADVEADSPTLDVVVRDPKKLTN